MHHATLVIVLLLVALKFTAIENFDFTILQTNRIYSAFDTYNNKYGIARAIKYIKDMKENSPRPVLYFDTMDCFFGSIYFGVHGWKICASFMSLLPVDAYGLGEHEMQDGEEHLGPENLGKYLAALSPATVLCTNCDLSKAPIYQKYITKSKIIEIDNRKIGVIAYIARDIPPKTLPLNITFTDEVNAVKQEVAKFKTQKVNIIILLAHCKAKYSRKITTLLTDIDIVVGGHFYELYYNGKAPIDHSYRIGDYPTEFTDASNKKVMEIRCGSQLRYVGKLDVTFDDRGILTGWNGNPVHMDETIEEDQGALEVLKEFKKGVEELQKQVVGYSRVRLLGDCIWNECNMGNLITDSFIYWFMTDWPKKKNHWTNVSIAIFASGRIRANIETHIGNNYSITYGDVLTVLPSVTTIIVKTMNASVLKRALEYSVNDTKDVRGRRFLQVSGLRVEYDFEKPEWQRIKTLKVRCNWCDIPLFETVVEDHLLHNPGRLYQVAMSSHLATGGYGFDMFANLTYFDTSITDVNALKLHIEKMTFVNPAIEERIVSLNCPRCEQNLPTLEN